MVKELQCFNKKIISEGITLEFNFRGIEGDKSIDHEEIDNLIKKVFDGYVSFDIVNMTKYIRTIFKDLDELILEIYLSHEYKKVGVQYLEKELISYSEEVYFDKTKTNKLIGKYEKGKEFNFYSTGCSDLSVMGELCTRFTNNIANLENVPAVYLTKDEIVLCRAYKLFYGDDPDFTDKDIQLKFKTMVTILKQFAIYLEYPLMLPENGRVPNLSLEETIKEFWPLGKINLDNYKEGILKEEIENDIKDITEIIRNSNIDILMLSEIIKNSLHHLPVVWDKDNILKKSNCTENDLDDCIKLVKKIDIKIFS